MKLNFRQGIVKAPHFNNKPRYLVPNGSGVSIDCSEGTVIASAAHYDANYLIDERSSVGTAWGPLSWNPVWGTEPVDPTYHLYWDIKVGSGEITRYFTPHTPQYGDDAPIQPDLDQHWFDTSTSLMKVMTEFGWKPVIRVFAGRINNAQITHNTIASQIEDNSNCDAGYIVYDMLKRGIITPNKTFLTSSDQLVTDHGSFSSPIRLELLNVSAAANEPIPAFCCVTSLKNGFVGLASTNEIQRPFAVTLTEGFPGESVDLISVGMLYNDQWDWDSNKSADLYCDEVGMITQDPPAGKSYRVATVISSTVIYVDIERYNSFTHVGDITYNMGGGGGGDVVGLPPQITVNENDIQFKTIDPPRGFAAYIGDLSTTITEEFGSVVGIDSNDATIIVGADGDNGIVLVVKMSREGEIIWQKALSPTDINNDYAVGDYLAIDEFDNIFVGINSDKFGVNNGPKHVMKLSPAGEQLWITPITWGSDSVDGSTFPTPTIAEYDKVMLAMTYAAGVVYVGFRFWGVVAINSIDGSFIWRTLLEEGNGNEQQWGNYHDISAMDADSSGVCVAYFKRDLINDILGNAYTGIPVVAKLDTVGEIVFRDSFICNPTQALLDFVPSSNPTTGSGSWGGMKLDSTGNLWVLLETNTYSVDTDNVRDHVMYKYSPSGTVISVTPFATLNSDYECYNLNFATINSEEKMFAMFMNWSDNKYMFYQYDMDQNFERRIDCFSNNFQDSLWWNWGRKFGEVRNGRLAVAAYTYATSGGAGSADIVVYNLDLNNQEDIIKNNKVSVTYSTDAPIYDNFWTIDVDEDSTGQVWSDQVDCTTDNSFVFDPLINYSAELELIPFFNSIEFNLVGNIAFDGAKGAPGEYLTNRGWVKAPLRAVMPFYFAGTPAIESGKIRWASPDPIQITRIWATAGTPGVNNSATFFADNGTTQTYFGIPVGQSVAGPTIYQPGQFTLTSFNSFITVGVANNGGPPLDIADVTVFIEYERI